ncbi:DUF4760 domain-containing protein [Pseudomonas sp. GM48]|uniref:DUF4760 domain-containing protein n=1 Tax=Pseudomonas sp. GM48 TaxID=1144330 RepID=UPI00026FDDCE|nr:DUF4760 domain-containing protein [Pseudomonas sp. GM48]EJM56195.1 hypothetical protein PMI28_03176 [Pseudomonas sp. GM48]
MLKRLSFSQGVFFTACCIFAMIAIVRSFNQILEVLARQSLNEWLYFGVFSFASALVITSLYRAISSKYSETKAGIRYISISFFVVTVTCYLVLKLQDPKGTDYQTSLALFVSSSLLGAGWWVQATINSAAARKAHTVSTIMNHRYSEYFFKRNDNFSNMFPIGCLINPAVIEHALSPTKSRYKDIKFADGQIQAAKDLNYVMNFYEFIAVGVSSGDFDEKLIRDCYEGIIIGIEKRGFHMIQFMRRTQGQKVFCSLVDLVDKWTDNQSMTTQYKNGNQSLDLGELTPSQENIDEMIRERDLNRATKASAEIVTQATNVTSIDTAHHVNSVDQGIPQP